MVFVHAELEDSQGTPVPTAWENVAFGVTGGAALIGANPFSSVAGIASILLVSEIAQRGASVYALAIVSDGARWWVLSAARGVDGSARAFEVRVTTDGTVPALDAPSYTEPLEGERVRAALWVEGERVVEADSAQERFRIPG
jgi:hypothetical protein